ncbi:DUF2065 domain-containing protein [Mesorhizobium sp. BR1-1-16]|uniref:DUF2065 domain-containing protein n=1 Tax=Mesorhizobium sp. BR1-1-16 TaxID=2876653 RepID=UPI001CCB22B2|nr:DUF2065 domain-containing protein [Mesorhizobium sp. BR1-1-16]MBZ9937652.1 DUF2065 domain-containing protein [Mesorhizobium sp. BR1-1-16]HWJ73396.1 DUF2065 domain-containing protein [Kaistia sp.]
MNDVVAAFGLVLVIEGVLYAAAPMVAKAMMKQGLAVPDGQLRAMGLIVLAAGVGVVWLARF